MLKKIAASADGEALPTANFNRRVALMGGLSAAAALAAMPMAHAGTEEGHDPLLDAVRAFRAGLADYNVNAPDDDDAAEAYIEISYGPPMDVLKEWKQPAKTQRAALEALRLVAEEEAGSGGSPIVPPLLAAAIAYFEAQS